MGGSSRSRIRGSEGEESYGKAINAFYRQRWALAGNLVLYVSTLRKGPSMLSELEYGHDSRVARESVARFYFLTPSTVLDRHTKGCGVLHSFSFPPYTHRGIRIPDIKYSRHYLMICFSSYFLHSDLNFAQDCNNPYFVCTRT